MTIHQYNSILIVDDSGATRSIVRKLLVQLGFKNIDEASDGKSALAKISKSFCPGDFRLEHGTDEWAAFTFECTCK